MADLRSPGVPADDLALLAACRTALGEVHGYLEAVKQRLTATLGASGEAEREALREHQLPLHGLAWAATYLVALRELLAWTDAAVRKQASQGAPLILQIVFGEYLSQLVGGIPLSQTEMVRPLDCGIGDPFADGLLGPACRCLMERGNTAAHRAALLRAIADEDIFAPAGEPEDLRLMREQFSRYTLSRIAPLAAGWHAEDALIPSEIARELADLGAFGLTIPTDYDGFALGKLPMCLVTEELARSSLAAASLGTRAEIGAELISLHGTEQQKREWLPAIASGGIFPAAVFTEPDTGSDLAHIRTRAERTAAGYRITGAKTWITHAGRAGLLMILARTDPAQLGARGLSLFLARKPPGDAGDPFPVEGLSGSEIPVIGYRGLKEYELAFDGFAVEAAGLLGGVEGMGFRQLMSTFESARIQTAARAVGLARGALEAAMAYAQQRRQFGRAIAAFPRISGKLAWMIAETVAARELTYFAARQKDAGRRCDVEAGMAKLLAARVAWSNADAAVQVHGGNGYAEEYAVSRMLCDARVLSIFEGAAEIQAEVIGKGLLAGRTELAPTTINGAKP